MQSSTKNCFLMSLVVYVVLPCGRHGARTVVGSDHLHMLQACVGGYIAILPHLTREQHGVVGYVRDDAFGTQANRLAGYLVQKIAKTKEAVDDVFGPLVIVSSAGDVCSITPERIREFDCIFARAVRVSHSNVVQRSADFRALLGNTNAVMLRRHLRVTLASETNGVPLLFDETQTLDTKVCELGSFSEHGVTIQRLNTGSDERRVYELLTTTVDNGFHRFSQYARLDDAGALQSLGVYNAFGVGMRTYRDQDEVDDLLGMLADAYNAAPDTYWDVIVPQ